jgi:hypothetical protein
MSTKSSSLALKLSFLLILICPVGIIVLAVLFHVPTSTESIYEPPWPWHAIGILFWLHVALSVAAIVIAVWATRVEPARLFSGCCAIFLAVVMLGITVLLAIWASMYLSGRYL